MSIVILCESNTLVTVETWTETQKQFESFKSRFPNLLSKEFVVRSCYGVPTCSFKYYAKGDYADVFAYVAAKAAAEPKTTSGLALLKSLVSKETATFQSSDGKTRSGIVVGIARPGVDKAPSYIIDYRDGNSELCRVSVLLEPM